MRADRKAVVAILVTLLIVSAGSAWIGYQRGREDGFELGLFQTADNITPVDPSRDLPAELDSHFVAVDSLAACRAAFDDYRRTEAANRANARLLGWNDGYAVGRDDWACQPWERAPVRPAASPKRRISSGALRTATVRR
jgi:hypothetical protein